MKANIAAVCVAWLKLVVGAVKLQHADLTNNLVRTGCTNIYVFRKQQMQRLTLLTYIKNGAVPQRLLLYNPLVIFIWLFIQKDPNVASFLSWLTEERHKTGHKSKMSYL